MYDTQDPSLEDQSTDTWINCNQLMSDIYDLNKFTTIH